MKIFSSHVSDITEHDHKKSVSHESTKESAAFVRPCFRLRDLKSFITVSNLNYTSLHDAESIMCFVFIDPHIASIKKPLLHTEYRLNQNKQSGV